MKVGRNKPCHCGSGKKYKHCHEISKKSNNNQYVIIGLVATVIVVLLFISTDRNESNRRTAISTSRLLNQPAAKSSSQPAGIAPPGKVWHEGHGHWHDAPLAASTPKKTSFNTNNSLARKSRPQGEAPPGKVWHEGHGHWHDAPNRRSITPQKVGDNEIGKLSIPTPGDKNNPPNGKIWDEEHGHFHDKQ